MILHKQRRPGLLAGGLVSLALVVSACGSGGGGSSTDAGSGSTNHAAPSYGLGQISSSASAGSGDNTSSAGSGSSDSSGSSDTSMTSASDATGDDSSGTSGASGVSAAESEFLNRKYAGTTIQLAVPVWQQASKKQLDAFTKLTGIKVDQQIIDWGALHTKIITAESAGQAPADITDVGGSWVGQFASAGWYSDLSTMLPKSLISDIAATAVFQANGKQIALPNGLDFRGTDVNMTMLKKAGITKPPTTWAEVKADAQKLKEKGVSKYPIALPLVASEETSTPWFALIRSAGGVVFNSDYSPAFGDPDSAGNKAAAFIADLYQSKLINPGAISLKDADVNNEFFSGQAAIVLSGSPALLQQVKKSGGKAVNDDLKFIAVPGPDGPAKSLIGLVEGFGIPANAPNKEAAAQYLYWRLSAEQQIAVYNDPNEGAIPSSVDALQQLADSGNLLGGQSMVGLAKLVTSPLGVAYPTWYTQFSSALASTLQNVAKGQISPDDGMAQLAAKVKTLKASGGS